MSSIKDGIPILIESFAQLSQKFTCHKLVIIGKSTNRSEMDKNLDLVKKFDIQKKVIFTGFVSREDMPLLLGHADLLVVSKPDNEQNSGNFPIKIGEYLATGIPVVTTKVGEIEKFITDGQTGFLAIPGSVESFYLKMKEALTDYEKSKQIGRNGKKIAEQFFDYKVQANKMAHFINQIGFSYGRN
jgi:glycosyltransferase involved in cell wall biosynthesis